MSLPGKPMDSGTIVEQKVSQILFLANVDSKYVNLACCIHYRPFLDLISLCQEQKNLHWQATADSLI